MPSALSAGPALPNEDAYAWSKLARTVLHTDNVDAQLGDGLPGDLVAGLPRATIDQVCAAPLIVTVGPDVKEELPVLYLRLRHAAVESGVPIIELSPVAHGALVARLAVPALHAWRAWRPGRGVIGRQPRHERSSRGSRRRSRARTGCHLVGWAGRRCCAREALAGRTLKRCGRRRCGAGQPAGGLVLAGAAAL